MIMNQCSFTSQEFLIIKINYCLQFNESTASWLVQLSLHLSGFNFVLSANGETRTGKIE